MSTSLAVAYRPRRFADVAGQGHIRAALTNAIRTGNIPHQLLLSGGSGLGKTTLARLFAAALFCPHRGADGDACGACESCLQVTGPGSLHPDVIELDAASYGGKDDIRDIAAKAALSPMRASHKLYIIDEAHGLTGAGAQAFLRLLEEPPAHVIFALATTDAHKLPAALRGRCLQLEVAPLTNTDLLDNLGRVAAGRGWNLPTAVAQACIDATDPALGVRGTVMSLEKIAALMGADGAPDETLVGAILGVATHTRLVSVTAAITAGDTPGALVALDGALLSGSVRGVHGQLVRWARTHLMVAARTRTDVRAAFSTFELLVSAGGHPGGLEVAVARAATLNAPQTAGPSSRVLLDDEQVHQVLRLVEDLRAAGKTVGLLDEVHRRLVDATWLKRDDLTESLEQMRAGAAEAVTKAAPTLGTPAAVRATVTPPTPASVNPAQARSRPPTQAPAGELLILPDLRLVALLNALSKHAPGAAAVVRRGTVFANGPVLTIALSPDLATRAHRAGLSDALESLRAAGGVDARWERP